MKRFIGEIIISKETPFQNCKLNRESSAKILTTIVNEFSSGFVLAINNEWGTGKTTFVKMWNQHLINDGFKTLYFNAWENDFDTEPMTAILGELKSLIGEDDNALFKSVITKGALLVKTMIPSIAKAVADKYINTAIVGEAIEGALTGVTEIFEKEIESYCKKKKSIDDFKEDLHKYIVGQSPEKPLVFFIDELDRCRPDYAVEVLEKVKHFFSVEGIVFILSIDKEQLENSVKGYYGTDKINSSEYLRRFIDVEYKLPEPKYDEFCKYLYDKFNLKEFLESDVRLKNDRLRNDSTYLKKFATILFKSKRLTIRQQEKIFSHLKIALLFHKPNNYLFANLYILLIYIREFEWDFFKGIRLKIYNPQEFIDKLEELFLSSIINAKRVDEGRDDITSYTIAEFVSLYCNVNERLVDYSDLFIDTDGGKKISIVSKNKYFDSVKLEADIRHFAQFNRDVSLNTFLDEIELLEDIN